MKSTHLLLFTAIYIFLFFILFPGYRYIIDPDSTGYFSVAEQLAKGDFHSSVNGIWSPLGSWILTPFLYLGFDRIPAAKYLNGFYGSVCLVAFFYLVKKMKIRFFIEIAIMIAAVLLMFHFTFYRLFGDLLQLLFLLLYLNAICSKKFGAGYKKIILAAFIGGIAFYAKSYAFYFMVVHLPVAIYLSGKTDFKKRTNLQFLKKAAAGLIILIATVSPWIIALNYKYGHFLLGRQNFSGSLSAAYNQPRVPFYAPPTPNAYSIFDDISYLKIDQVTPFTNGKLFLAQLKLIGFNFTKLVEHFNDFSFAFLMIIITSAFLFLGKLKTTFNEKNYLLLLSFIVTWPLGLILFHVEPRYLWIMILVVLTLAGILLTCLADNYPSPKKNTFLFSLLIIGSFCIYPLLILKDQYGSGKNYFEIAAAFKRNNISGNILYSNQGGAEIYQSVIINYLSKCRHFGPFTTDYSTQEVAGAIKNYHINYFILYYTTPYQKDILLSSTLASNATTILTDIYPGIIVLKFN